MRCSGTAPVFTAAVMEYLCAEILDMATEVCHKVRKKRIMPKMIIEAIRNDVEFKYFLNHVEIFDEKNKRLGSIAQINEPFDMKY